MPVESTHAEFVTATIRPSAVLRVPADRREETYAGLVDDLRASFALLAHE